MKQLFLITLICLYGMQISSAQPIPKRTLAELINIEEPAWPEILKEINTAKNSVLILHKVPLNADTALLEAQVTTRSPMGAVIFETGGILIDNGWIRIIGSGSPKLSRSIMRWNQRKSFQTLGVQPTFLLIADDAIGGLFAINAGGLASIGIGKVFYFSPDNLKWVNLELTYSGFLQFCFNADLEKFYKGNRWKNWRDDAAGLAGDKSFLVFPYLWSKEGKDIEQDSKSPVPIQEMWDLYFNNQH